MPYEVHEDKIVMRAGKYDLPKREWVDLTDDEISQFDVDPVEAKALIQKLKEKNT